MSTVPIGFGCDNHELALYIANRPPVDDYPTLDHLRPLAAGELQHIVSHTSNHWRKVFNVYAKFLFALAPPQVLAAGSWQQYRDRSLLQLGCTEALLFSAPDFSRPGTVHIVAGKTYGAQLDLPPLQWLDSHFAVNVEQRLVVCPYPDYRQLSNERIDRLVELVKAFSP
ncbi:hypothetical protein G8764_02870 [Pseudomaricurvus alcaniphilus]|uniref:DUF6942 family protein n=1 Tax=Pseudomaricurvus alcaniphilus TaxID=1166482 RepID=UPI00140B29BD|nr:hypothetical protein [Pseudomaricurvus alcaniphilus]